MITFSANLRLKATPAERANKIQQTLDQLQLNDCANTYVHSKKLKKIKIKNIKIKSKYWFI